VFPVRYELYLFMLFGRYSVYKGLTITEVSKLNSALTERCAGADGRCQRPERSTIEMSACPVAGARGTLDRLFGDGWPPAMMSKCFGIKRISGI
jgi:hypothetical protein